MAARAPRDRIFGCLLGGAIGDAFGGVAERGRLCLSDDTQLTLATCEAMVEAQGVDPEIVARYFTERFTAGHLTGLGSSTLKALRDLQAGAHWAVAGARGEMAAGNGGAMRIAPLAFTNADRGRIRDTVRITHHNDEAYVGALAVVTAIRSETTLPRPEWIHGLASSLPDSRVRDRLLTVAEVSRHAGLAAVAALGTSGWVVDTVPLALVAAWQMEEGSFDAILEELIQLGGDTDTIASIAGQVAGARSGRALLPESKWRCLPERAWVEDVAERFSSWLGR